MPINLDRAEKIGNDFSVHSPVKLDPNYKFADIEVLTINKVPLTKLSFIKDDHYECPTCGDSSRNGAQEKEKGFTQGKQ